MTPGRTLYCSHSITWIQRYYTCHLEQRKYRHKSVSTTTVQAHGVWGQGRKYHIGWGKLSLTRTLLGIHSCSSISTDECLLGNSHQVVISSRWLVWSSKRFFSQVDTIRPFTLSDITNISYKPLNKLWYICARITQIWKNDPNYSMGYISCLETASINQTSFLSEVEWLSGSYATFFFAGKLHLMC
jgi:hypothetical protein